ncbi:MAG: hypothetical protein WCE79_10575 [Xanthobacteraceae bacterium]
MLKRMIVTSCVFGVASIASAGSVFAQHTWSDYSAAAAIGYCMAVHRNGPAGGYTNGFENVAPPGVAGAVRRNFVYGRAALPRPSQDVAAKQTCADACVQWGKAFSGSGKPLHTGSAATPVQSGIGDIAATALKDWDFYHPSDPPVVAGISGRPQNYQSADVAQADFCCCHLH